MTLRLGLLGAARITPAAVIYAADAVPEVSVTAVAARDPARAEAFAQEHTVPSVAENYAALIARDDVDAVYVALHASHHLAWVEAALAAGKAVLCEKPLSGNAPALRSLLQTGDGPVSLQGQSPFGIRLFHQTAVQWHPLVFHFFYALQALRPML